LKFPECDRTIAQLPKNAHRPAFVKKFDSCIESSFYFGLAGNSSINFFHGSILAAPVLFSLRF
jgi:hypothetical protein